MYLFVALIFAMFAVGYAEASQGFDFGDFLALCLGISISVTGVLACLGSYSRKLARSEFI